MRVDVLILLLATSWCSEARAQDKETLEIGTNKVDVPACGPAYAGPLESGAVTVLVGDSVCFSAVEVDGRVALTAPNVGADPKTLLVLKLWQDPATRRSFLQVHNPFGKFLVYRAQLLRAGRANREYTSTCPVLSRREAFEMWPYPVQEITVSDFSLAPEKDSIECL